MYAHEFEYYVMMVLKQLRDDIFTHCRAYCVVAVKGMEKMALDSQGNSYDERCYDESVTDHWLAKLSLGVHKGLFENYFG